LLILSDLIDAQPAQVTSVKHLVERGMASNTEGAFEQLVDIVDELARGGID